MRACSVLVLAILFPAADVAAQLESAEYRAIITAAVQEFDASRFAEARALFRRAHVLSPNARTLRGIGLSSFEMSDYVEAYTALSSSLAETSRPLTETQRIEVGAVLSRAESYLGFYRVETTPSSATVTIDGARAVTAADGRVILGMGSHEIAARASGYRGTRLRVRVQGGENEQLELQLELVVSGGASESNPGPVDAPPRASHDVTPSIVVLSLGVAAVVGAGLAGGLWLPDRELELAACDAAFPFCDNGDALRTERDASIAITIVLAIGGAAAVVAGLVLLVAPLVSGASSAELACGAEGTSIGCRF